MVCSAMGWIGERFCRGQNEGEIASYKKRVKWPDFPPPKTEESENSRPPNFEWQQNAPCLPQRQKLNSVKIFIAF